MSLLSTVVDWQHTTFLIIPEVCLRIFPNFPNTEAAFEWCSTKVVVLQKRCDTMQLLHTWEKPLIFLLCPFRKVLALLLQLGACSCCNYCFEVRSLMECLCFNRRFSISLLQFFAMAKVL